ncbi:MAG: sigma-E processing peptidase SpoIIGA [Bacilli bacterium]|nr:sigma-E processing peptidase SpoIIGA [Bacilli bacterium]
MTIYLDLVFFINLFFDFILLTATKHILKQRVKLYRLILGSLIGSLSIFFLFININSIELFIFKIIISILMILISFGKKNFIKNYMYFYIISIFLGGSMYFLNLTFSSKNQGLIFFSNGLSINFIVMIILSPIIIYYYVKEYKNYKNTITNCYLIDLYINNKKYCLKGYLDTGNTLIDPYKKRGVILLNLDKLKLENNNKIIYVPYKTITNNGVIKCFKIDKIIINNKEFTNLLIGDVKNHFKLENADCILPNMIREEI